MWLINVSTLELEEFYGDQVPKYAILSHTWGQGEVTFQDWKDPNMASQKAGFAKILGACRQASKDSLEYLWVDTNCIDKTSSAELSEAINSMFAWYRDAEVCYAFLVDVPSTPINKLGHPVNFHESRWFTRGWTLQELLAPRDVIFFDPSWQRIGNRSGPLAEWIASITKINVNFITGQSTLVHANVAQKMSWLSRRVTTRVEDLAYCMLGIFDINMPLLYGEGKNAFLRLQEEIIKTSTDHTIFCWTWVESVPQTWTSMLAPTPRAFEFSSDYFESKRDMGSPEVSPYSLVNAGISIKLPLVSAWDYSFALLDAHYRHSSGQCAIPLRYIIQFGAFRRISFPPDPTLIESWAPEPPRKVLVRARSSPLLERISLLPGFKYGLLFTTARSVLRDIGRDSVPGDSPLSTSLGRGFVTTYPPGLWDSQRSLIMFPIQHSRFSNTVMVQIRTPSGPALVMLFAIRFVYPRRVLWFCKFSPESAWDNIGSVSEAHLENFKQEISGRTENIMCSDDGYSEFHLDIIYEPNISSPWVVGFAHVSRKGEPRGNRPDYCDYGRNGY
ncbi:hypothetical protein LCI18_006698 [Fusarium solani-melongenae]|uniref:Uncharacterized protein n=1 Tax=Fusarium solani subsp. cucurbitae TaxID=2747967 RepID=A0ACD3Z6Q4_FUSSC|nr:hypothetical protein LCI18_006698 [Fusarium solani-melongenae]